MNQFLAGAIAMASWAIGLFFVRFWKKTRDRFFALMGIAFWVLALERVIMASLVPAGAEGRHLVYFARLLAFLLIIVAIIDKNRGGPARSASR